METSKTAERLSQLRPEIGYAIGRGEWPENTINEFLFLYESTPDQEKEGFSLRFKSLVELIKEMRRNRNIVAGSGKLKCVPVNHILGTDQELNNA